MGIAGGGQKGGRIERVEGGREGKASDTNVLCTLCVLVEHLPSAPGEQLQLWTGKLGCPARFWGAATSASWLCEHEL